MDKKQRLPVNLNQYRKLSGKWQFLPVAREAKASPAPRRILLKGQPVSSKRGTFYLDFSEKWEPQAAARGDGSSRSLETWQTWGGSESTAKSAVSHNWTGFWYLRDPAAIFVSLIPRLFDPLDEHSHIQRVFAEAAP
jgi:hypothetical protein